MSGRYSSEVAPIWFLQGDGSVAQAPSVTPMLEVLIPASIDQRPDGQMEVNDRGEGWRRQFALIDTGAQMSGMASGVVVALKLDPVARISVAGVTGAIDMEVVSHPIFLLGARTTVNADFTRIDAFDGRAYMFLLGMDVLSQGRLVMDRQAGEFYFRPWIPD